MATRRVWAALALALLVGAAAGPGAWAQGDGRGANVNALNAGAEAPRRLVLTGVPRVGPYPRQSTSAPEDHALPGCLRATLEFLRDDIYPAWLSKHGKDWHPVHQFFMGTSGIAFQFTWEPGKWECPSWNPFAMAEDPLEPVRCAFESVGYAHEVMLRTAFAREVGLAVGGSDDEALYRRRIVESIRNGRPVIAFGGLSGHDACLIAGYDDAGDVIVGWDFFYSDDERAQAGVEADPSGYVRRRGWFASTHGILLVGEKGERPPLREVYRKALERGARLLRGGQVRGAPSGHAGYRAWMDDLLSDAAFLGLDLPALGRRQGACGGTWGHIAEARAWGGGFLAQAAALEPAWAEELNAAAACFEVEHNLFLTVKGDGDAARYADPWVRRRLVPPIRVALASDEEAAAHIERALAK